MLGRRLITATLAGGGLLVAGVSAVLAQPGTAGTPGDGPDARGARAEVALAAAHPGAEGHAEDGAAGGMPMLHGLSGGEFGPLIADLARSAPGAVARHFLDLARERAPEGVPDVTLPEVTTRRSGGGPGLELPEGAVATAVTARTGASVPDAAR
jgi:hypothetical protein